MKLEIGQVVEIKTLVATIRVYIANENTLVYLSNKQSHIVAIWDKNNKLIYQKGEQNEKEMGN